MYCSKCGKELSDTEKFCKNCGTSTDISKMINEVTCPNCGKLFKRELGVCPNCGTLVKEAPTNAAPVREINQQMNGGNTYNQPSYGGNVGGQYAQQQNVAYNQQNGQYAQQRYNQQYNQQTGQYAQQQYNQQNGQYISKKEFINKYAEPSLRNNIRNIAIFCYVCAGLTFVVSCLLNPFGIIDALLLAGFALGMHLGKSKVFAILILVLSIIEVIAGLVSGAASGVIWVVAGITAVITFNKIDKQYKQFLYSNNMKQKN